MACHGKNCYRHSCLRSTIIFLFILFMCSTGEAQVDPTVVANDNLTSAPYSANGLIQAPKSQGLFRGSAFEAFSDDVIITAAHVVFDCLANPPDWAGDPIRFYPRYSDSAAPSFLDDENYILLGPYIDSGYAELYRNLKLADINNGGTCGFSNDQIFAQDFAVYWIYEPDNGFEPLPLATDPENALLGTSSKLVIGYPDINGVGNQGPNEFSMFETGPFSSPFERVLGSYFENSDAGTFRGNSGGPVLVQEAGEWRVAGVLVSGEDGGIFTDDFIGVNAIGADELALLQSIAGHTELSVSGTLY